MARFKHYDMNQTKMIPVSYADQVLEGSFEHALNEIVEEHLDLSVFDHRCHNDATVLESEPFRPAIPSLFPFSGRP
ncbi:MAG TPA: hypothetical protein VIV60_02935 [Polyangiaceae bacterium]